MSRIAKVAVDLEANSAKFVSGLSRADSALAASGAKWQRSMAKMEAGFTGLGTVLTTVLAGVGAGSAVSKLYDVNAEFQKLGASLKTVTGSQAAAENAMAWIKDFAAETPYQLSQVTDAFIKLKAMGLDASIESMRSYGNTASAMGKPINMMIEAVADAATGEFERLKEFGIKASSQGDEVKFTFQGVTTTVKKNAAEIEEYLRKLGEVQFSGAMSEQMATLGGQTSNLADQFDALMVAIGKAGSNRVMADTLNFTTDAVKGLTNAINDLGDTEKKIERIEKRLEALGKTSLLGDIMSADLSTLLSGDIKDHRQNSLSKQLEELKALSASEKKHKMEQDLFLAMDAETKERSKASATVEANAVEQATIKLREKTAAVEALREKQNAADEERKRALEDQIKLEDAKVEISDNLKQEISDNERLIAALQISEAEYERVAASLELLNTYRQAGIELSPEELEAAGLLTQKLGEQRVKMDELRDKSESLKKLGADMGMTFSSVFEDAIVEGKEFSDVLQGIAQDILRIMTRQMVTQPLTNALGSAFSGLAGSIGGALFSGGQSVQVAAGVGTGTGGLYADGGLIGGVGGGRSDSNLIRASRGEFIINAASTARYLPLLKAINSNRLPAYANGGLVGQSLPSLSEANIGRIAGDTYHIDARGAAPGVEEKIGGVIRDIQTLRSEVPAIAVKSVRSANSRGAMT